MCGSPPPGQSCQSIACSGSRTCNLGQHGGEHGPSGCCCDALCDLLGDCCADKVDCCGSGTSEPRRGQPPVVERTETAAFSTERITPRGINVARGINTRTGMGLLLPRQDGVQRGTSDDVGPSGITRAAWAPAPAESPSPGDQPEEEQA